MASEKEVEDQLFESGNKLVEPPSSVDELLPLLDSVEKCLLNVEQSPDESMQIALAPSLKALVDDKLIRHSNVDVKVSVASCISEITRITAPEAPYDDDRMKEVFQLIVSSFENLSDNESRSYAKRTSILQTVAKVRSCVVMLDLECDALIVEMFQHFLDSIRDHHPENVITAMETIMTLVLEESEDISVELLSPILACLRNDNKEVLSIAKGLGKKVLLNCAEKVKPYLLQAVKALDSAVIDYDEFVANICQGVDDDGEQTKVQDDEIMGNESEPVKPSSDKEAQDGEEDAKEATSEKVDPSGDMSPQSALSNGVAAESALEDSSPIKKQEDDHPVENTNDLTAENVDSSKPVELAGTDEEAVVTSEKEETASSPVKSSDSPLAGNEKQHEDIPDGQGQTEDVPSPHHAVPSEEASVPVEKEEKSDVKLSPSKTSEPASVSPTRNSSDEILEKAEPSEKDSLGEEASRSSDDSKKVADATSDPGDTDALDAQKKMPAANSVKTKALEDVDVPMKDSETKIVPTVKPSRYARKKVLDSDEVKSAEVDIPMKDTEDTSESEVKHSTRSRKKVAADGSGEIKASAEADTPMKDSEDTSDLDLKHSRRARKKVNSAEIKASADVDVPMKDSGGASDSEVKHGRHTRRKAAAVSSGDIKASEEVDVDMKDNEATSDSEVKPLKQSVKKVDGGSKKNTPMKDSEATSDSEEKPLKRSAKKVDGGSKKSAPIKESEPISDSEEKSLKKKGESSKKNVKAISSKQEDKKMSARRKSVGEKDVKKAPAKDNTKDTIASPKSSGKSVKDVDTVKETPKTDPKRKRTPGKEKETAKDFGESLVDSKIRVYWPDDKKYYDGTIVSFDLKKKKHTVLYNDGDEEILNLRNERWEFIGRGSRSDDEEETAQSGPEDSPEMPQKKRSKIKTDDQAKPKKVQASPKKGGGSTSSKSKATTATPKSRSGKSDSKAKDEKPAKSAVKSDDQTPKSGGTGKSTIISFKSPSKSKNTESQTLKGSTESTTKSKASTTTPKPQGKSTTKTSSSKDKPNGKSKSGSSSSKAKELAKITKEVEEHDDEETGSEELKGKSKGGEAVKSGKKRRRGVKG